MNTFPVTAAVAAAVAATVVICIPRCGIWGAG